MEHDSKRIPQLDGIRGIAIILVMIWHYVFGWWMDAPISPDPHSILAKIFHLLSFSWSGVDLFFVLSGFLIGGILIDNRESDNYFQTFYVRRIFRILPLYYAVLVIGLLLYPGKLATSSDVIPIGWYLTISQNIYTVFCDPKDQWFGYVWSLCVEEQFYLCLPLLIWLLPKRTIRPVCVFLVLVAIMTRCVMARQHIPYLSIYVFSPARMDALFIGVICAGIYRDETAKLWLTKNTNILYGALFLFGAAISMLLYKNYNITSMPMTTIGYTLIALFYATFLLIAVTERQGPVVALTKLRPLRRMGILAYFIFLTHYFVPFYVFRFLHRSFDTASFLDWALLFFSGTLVVAAAEVSWRLFEAPLVAIGHRLASYHSTSRSPPAMDRSYR